MDHELGRLLDMSRSLLEQARADDWEGVEHTEQSLRPLLYQYFSARPAGELPEADRRVVQEMLDNEREVERLARASRDAIAGQLQTLNRGRSAAAEYAANRNR